MQVFITALSQAAVLAPMAVGIALVYRIGGVINFAAGTICVAAGYVVVEMGGSPLALAGGCLVGGALGVATFSVAVLPGKSRGIPPVAMTLSTLGFALILQAAGDEVFGTSPRTTDPWVTGSLEVLGTSLSAHRAIAIGVSALVVIVVIALFDRTLTGRGMEACSADESLTQLYGVRTLRFHLLAWFISGACCALSGGLQAGLASISDSVALPLLIGALIAAVLGGIGSLRASVLGALAVALVGAWVQSTVNAQIPLTPVFIVLIVGLALRPSGMFTRAKTGERV